jgi:hypothetical protein
MSRHRIALLVWVIATPVHSEPAHRPLRPVAILKLEQVPGAGTALRASTHGHEGLFLFDTGEGVSTISPAFARQIGCTPWGQITGFRMSGERLDFPRCENVPFRLGPFELSPRTTGVFDIMSLLPDSKTVLAGSLGLDVFDGKPITIEPAADRIVIESSASFRSRINRAKPLPSRIVRDAEGAALAIDVAVPTSRGTAWMELDTGNGGTLVIGKHIAALLGLNANSAKPQHAQFQLDGGVPVSGEARVRDLIMDGNIGQRFWRNWNTTIDLKTGRVWIAPN